MLSNEKVIKPYIGVIGTSVGGERAAALSAYCPKVFLLRAEILLLILQTYYLGYYNITYYLYIAVEWLPLVKSFYEIYHIIIILIYVQSLTILITQSAVKVDSILYSGSIELSSRLLTGSGVCVN